MQVCLPLNPNICTTLSSYIVSAILIAAFVAGYVWDLERELREEVRIQRLTYIECKGDEADKIRMNKRWKRDGASGRDDVAPAFSRNLRKSTGATADRARAVPVTKGLCGAALGFWHLMILQAGEKENAHGDAQFGGCESPC